MEIGSFWLFRNNKTVMWLFVNNHSCFSYIQITSLNNKNTFGAPYFSLLLLTRACLRLWYEYPRGNHHLFILVSIKYFTRVFT